MANLTTTLINNLLNHGVTGKSAYTKPTVSLGLQTAIPGDDGSGGTEVIGGSYGRLTPAAGNWAAATAKAAENSAVLTFAVASANWGEVRAVTGHDDPTAGSMLWVAPLVVPASKKAFTANSADEVFTSPAHGLADGDKVLVENILGLSLPTGVSEGTPYFVIAAGLTTNTFELSATLGGSAINLTASGVGMVVKTAFKQVDSGDTFKINIGDLDFLIDA